MPSTRSSVTAYSFGPRRYANIAASRQLARQAVIQGRRLAPPSLPIDISRATLNRLAGGRSRYNTSNGEVKSFDQAVTTNTLGAVTAVSGTEPGTAFGGITCLNEVQQGAAFYNRIGSKIKMISLQIKFDMYQSTATAGAASNARYMIVYDRQPNGAFPTYSTLLALNDSAPTTSTAYAGINMANRSRFTVLRDRVVSTDAAYRFINHVEDFITMGLETEYKATNGNIGDITTGSLLLVGYLANGSGATVNFGEISTRLRYLD